MGVGLQVLPENIGGVETTVTLRNFDIPDELWKDFLAAMQGQYNTASEALRDLMRQFVRERKKKEGER